MLYTIVAAAVLLFIWTGSSFLYDKLVNSYHPCPQSLVNILLSCVKSLCFLLVRLLIFIHLVKANEGLFHPLLPSFNLIVLPLSRNSSRRMTWIAGVHCLEEWPLCQSQITREGLIDPDQRTASASIKRLLIYEDEHSSDASPHIARAHYCSSSCLNCVTLMSARCTCLYVFSQTRACRHSSHFPYSSHDSPSPRSL